MASPFAFEIKSVTNDVVSSKEIKPTYTGGNKKGAYNAYRIDTIEMLVAAHAGIIAADYFIIEVGYDDLNGDAITELKNIDDKEYIERQMIGPYLVESTANYGQLKSDDPAKKPLIFKFKNCFCLGSSFWLNILIHGLGAARDCQFIMRGNPVSLLPMVLKAHTTKREI